MSASVLFQEELPLRAAGRFRSVIDAAELGIEPALLELLVADGPLCFLDFEATGLDPRSDALIEAGAAIARSGSDQIEIFNSFIHTDLILSPFIKRLTGIEQSDIDEAPPMSDVAAALDAFIGETPVVAHNAVFEKSWLVASVSGRFAEHPFLDTVDLLAIVYPDSPNMKLDTFCRAKLDRRERHRALDDALDTLRLAANIFAESAAGSTAAENAYVALRQFMPNSPWRPRLGRAPKSEVRSAGVERAEPVVAEPLGPVPFDFDAIAARLGDTGAAEKLIPDYRPRPEQLALLRHVIDGFNGKDGKTVRICEAGTGIGKTLAYLAAAIPFVRETGSQVIVSTSSKLLQRQLIEKDIPAAARLLGHDDLRYTLMKGRANYLCRARLDRFLDNESSLVGGSDSFATALVASFASSAGHGEVDRIPGVLYQMHPQLERCRREIVSGDATECKRDTCQKTRGHCVFREARNRLDSAEIIVVNHDLLLRWPPDYPQLEHLIIDEIHDLAERADAAYAQSADGVEIRHRVESLLSEKKGSRLATDESIKSLAEEALRLVPAVGAEARAVVGEERGNFGFRDELAIPADGPGPTWSALIDYCGELAARLSELGQRLSDLIESDDHPAVGTAETLIDAASVIRQSLPLPNEDFVCRFRALARRSDEQWRLIATPVSPAADFQFEILDRVRSLFATSATVAVGSDARGALGSLELEERAAERYRLEESIASPFDYERNLRVAFARDRMKRNQLVDNTVEVLATLATQLGGSTMGLFTSRERLASATDLLDRKLSPHGITIVAPSSGNADPHDLVRTFMESPHAVLLGARAFWQGVDVPGDACQALVIEKYPFDVPGDPLIQRRTALIEEAGGSGFFDYSLPRMLLRLKQMVGRLIRTPADRGLVVIVESRCDKSYFKRVYDALPQGAETVLAPIQDLQAIARDFFDRDG